MRLLAYKRGILAWYDCYISTGKVEGINNKIKNTNAMCMVASEMKNTSTETIRIA